MVGESAPIIVAYDGSEISRAALRHATELFPGRPTIVATVWEPGLAALPVGPPDPLSLGTPTVPYDPETVQAVDRVQRQHAARVAEEGAKLAGSLGATAEPLPVEDEVDVADTLIHLARERGAAAIVMGSHGISGLRTRLLGSVSRKVIQHGGLPVLVIREERRTRAEDG